jgi:predicted SnoaL-like aldol condensation-catalyzing enzyme
MPTNKEIAQAFLTAVVSGDIENAYEKYVSPNFFHHNAYYKSDRQSLMDGMKENHANFPNKKLEIKRTLEDGDLVAVHSCLMMNPAMPEIAVVHIFRLENGLIVEEWDIGQQLPEKVVNERGPF